MAYNLLSRDTFDAAVDQCLNLQWEFDSQELEVPILLLGVNINNRDWSNSKIGEQEALEVASSLQVACCEARLDIIVRDANTLSPIDEPFINITRMIRQAVGDYMDMKNHKVFAGTKRPKKLISRTFKT